MRIVFAAFPTYDLLAPELREAVAEVDSWEELHTLARTPSIVPRMTALEERATFRDTGEPVGNLANFCTDRHCTNECCFPSYEEARENG
jgi:hypothetical protein